MCQDALADCSEARDRDSEEEAVVLAMPVVEVGPNRQGHSENLSGRVVAALADQLEPTLLPGPITECRLQKPPEHVCQARTIAFQVRCLGRAIVSAGSHMIRHSR